MSSAQPDPQPREVRIAASGMSFAALEWGALGGRLALCLHGYPDTAWTWRHLGPALAARGWRVIAPFMRGYAPTDLAPDGCYQIGALVRDAAELHGALGGDGRAVVIGHDWGAVAAYAAVAHSPQRFARMVALAIPPLPAVLGVLSSPRRLLADRRLAARQARRSWYMAFQQLPLVSEAALPLLIPRLWSAWSPGYDAAEDLPRVAAAMSGAGRPTAALRYYRAVVAPWLRSPRYRDEQAFWASVPDRPVLYLHGADDGCVLADHAPRAERLLAPGSAVQVVPGAGHFLQLECPQAVNALVAEFLASQEPG